MKNSNSRIGILTWHYYTNPGSSLQSFALQTILMSMGYNVHIINYRSTKFGVQNGIKYHIKRMLVNVAEILFPLRRFFPDYNVVAFQQKYLRQSQLVQIGGDLTKIIWNNYDVIIYGSDQIWAPNVFDPIYMGAFVPDGIRKISYAASIGLNDIPENLIHEYKIRLSKFYAISVREQKGMEILSSRCGIEATVVLDPTLLIDVDVYLNMQKKIDNVSGSYIFCYFLNKEHKYRERVIQYANKYHFNIIGISDNPNDNDWLHIIKYVGADQFLWLINHAEVIFTDSYHCTIFSLLFHKKIWIFKRFSDDSPICQNSRINQLIEYFNISDRLISFYDDVSDIQSIDYLSFEKKLLYLKNISMRFLKQALK